MESGPGVSRGPFAPTRPGVRGRAVKAGRRPPSGSLDGPGIGASTMDEEARQGFLGDLRVAVSDIGLT